MGHASITITLDRYGHLFPGSEDEAAELLDAYLAESHERTEGAAADPTVGNLSGNRNPLGAVLAGLERHGRDAIRTHRRRGNCPHMGGFPAMKRRGEVSGFRTYVPGDRSLMTRDIGHTVWVEAGCGGRRGGAARRAVPERRSPGAAVRGWADSRGHVPSSCCCSPGRF